MKLGICSMWGESLDQFRSEVRLASDLGYDLISIGDSPSGWHEMVTTMTIAALEAPKAQIASLVTSPFMRHPLVAANAFSSLDDLTGGRAVLGLATGGSTVLAVGRMPATQTEIRAEIDAYKRLFAGEEIAWEGRPVKSLRFARPVPIYYSAFGPKALQLAGEEADGAIIFAGDQNLEATETKIKAIRDSATRAGRNADDIDIWVTSYISVRHERSQAIEDLKAFIAVNAMALRTPQALSMLPSNVRPLIEAFQTRYDPSEHVVVGGKNVQLMDEMGLTEFLQDFDTIAGPEEHMTEVMRKLDNMGVSTLIAALPGHADPLVTISGLATARGAL
ncbi:MAG: methylene-tetrahydromethanopterin reductase [Hirschia sp.]|nr:methylene-tetrahydromethanopterin reductase [Hirschia sp.]MBF16835.1 methylene-tetrahydromethanopterin reductase [Hirschia sp.]|tara:strand:+ start:268 stop:1269 length:1002 start_codon:yes stop_codon:yes gene_type:complete